MLHFNAIIYYMGLVRLPNKRAYWSTDVDMPSHPVLSGMSRDRFEFIWRFLRLTDDDLDATEPNAAGPTGTKGMGRIMSAHDLPVTRLEYY